MNDLKTDTFTKMIKAAALHAPKKDCRYYLNGVFFTLEGNDLCLVGTDGHRLLELKNEIWNPYAFSGSFILGHDVLKVLLATLATGREVSIKAFDGVNAIFAIDSIDYSFVTINGKYPDYHRVIRSHDNTREQPTSEYGINIDYLADIQKACKLFKRKFNGVKLSIKDASTSIKWTACLDSDNQVHGLGLIMPARL